MSETRVGWDPDQLAVRSFDGESTYDSVEYYDVDLWTCLRCGSLVRGLFKDTHESWHAEQER